MKGISKRIAAQAVAFAMTFQMVGQISSPFISAKVYADDEVQQDNKSEDLEITEPENAEYVNQDEGFDEEPQYEDMTISSGTTLNALTEVKNLYIDYGTLDLNGNTLIVHGDVFITNCGKLNFNKGELICDNFLMSSGNYEPNMLMQNPNDRLIVNGNFDFTGGFFSGSNANAGTIEVSGNVNITSGFNPTNTNKFILSGLEQQTLYINGQNCSFNILEVANTGEDGVVCTSPISANSTIGSLGQLHFTAGGEEGFKLISDSDTVEIDENYCLAAGDLDLNGKTLIINGDFIQSGGNVILNGGHLIVNGDYRIQTKNGDNYTYSTGTLNMTNESDIVEVSGDFVMGSTKSHDGKLTNGTLIVGGDFSQVNVESNSAYNFKTSGNHTTVFNANESGHTISFANASSGNSHFTNLTFGEDSKIEIPNTAIVTGVLDGTDCTVTGYINLSGTASVNGKYCGSLKISEAYTLNSNINITGNLYADSTLSLGSYELNVDGDITQNDTVNINNGILHCKGNYTVVRSLKLNSGKVFCDGDFSVPYYYGFVSMKDSKCELHVGGNCTFSGIYYDQELIAGNLYIKGDCNVTTSTFKSGSDYNIILNGEKLQRINVTDSGAKLSQIIIQNRSVEGIEILKAFDYDNITNESNAKIYFADGGAVATREPQTEETKTIDGNFNLAMGDLDLNGKTLIINGDFIQSGGNVILNGGHLIVKGDYRIQTKNGEDAYTYSTGTLNMTNESDIVEVSGDFVMGSTKSHDGLLTNGTLTVGGDFSQLNVGASSAYNFKTSGEHTTVFKANEDGHTISFVNASSGSSHFTNLTFGEDSKITISNTAVVIGTLDGTDCTVSGYVTLTEAASVNGKYCGSLKISDAYTLNSNINIAGNLYADSTLSLGSYELNVDGDIIQNDTININNGILHCKGNYTVVRSLKLNSGKVFCDGDFSVPYYYGFVSMKDSKCELHVGGNCTFSGIYYDQELIAGNLYIKGDCNVTTSTFKSGSDYNIILNGEKLQRINVTDSGAKLSQIIIQNRSVEGIEILKAFDYDNITNESNAKIYFADGGAVATGEPQTEETKTIDGNYNLAMGDLDLNGKTLIINGDFIQSGGNVILNGGHLIVNGDYRIQTKNGENDYTYSTGTLNMTNESDIVEVSGDFVMGSTKSHDGLLTNGTLTVGGDFSQLNVGASSAYNFKTSGEHTTVFKANEDGHTISFVNASSGCSHFTNLTFGEDSKIEISNTAIVTGVLDGTDCTVTGYINLSGTASVNRKYCGSLRIGEDYTLNSNIETAGDLLVNSTLYLGSYEFNVDGNIIQDSSVNVNSGIIHCKGNYSVNNYLNTGNGKVIADGNLNVSYWNGRIYMQNSAGEIHVGQNFSFDGGSYSSNLFAGKLYVGGNCNVYRSDFQSGTNLDIIFDGSDKQIINVIDSNAKLSQIIIRNTSEDGIEIAKVFNYDNITNETGANIYFADGGIVATGEPQTEETKTIDGNYNLAMGDLDLNGKTLIINGDFIQSGGNVTLNGGHLIVKGDYRIQTKNGEDAYTYSTGTLNMTNESDIVEVSGDFVMGSTKSHDGKLTNGTLIVGGNFTQLNVGSSSAYNFKTSDNHTTVIKGKNKQTIYFDNPDYSYFTNVSFENVSAISLTSSVYAYGQITDTYGSLSGESLYISRLSQINGDNLSGNINLTANADNSHLSKDLNLGNLTCNYIFLDGYRLNVNSISVNNRLDIGKGYLEVKNNCYLNTNSYFYMTESEARVIVGGIFTINSNHDNTLTNGTLEIKGDFIHNKDSQFLCSDEHTTILSGKSASNGRAYVQTISMYKSGSKFNKLIITRPQTLFDVKYYSTGEKAEFTDICEKFTEDFDDLEPPTKVTGVSASERTATSIHLVWNASEDNVRVTGYEVYRNGEKLATTGRTEFIDQSLDPDTAYTYQIYAFDEERNYSEGSAVMNTRTLEDTDAPDTPQNLKFSAVTGSALTLSWNPSKDNVGTAGYIIYRDNEELARIEDCEYKDIEIKKGNEYSYMIKAYDEAGNLSDFSENITGSAVMPKISFVTPDADSSLGGGTQDITVVFDKIGDGSGNKVFLNWKEAGSDDYEVLTSEPLYAEPYSANKLCAKYTWATAGLDGNYDIQAVLYDADDNSDTYELSYSVTSSGPKAPQELKAVSKNGTVELTWKRTSSSDCKEYIIYRLDPDCEEYKTIAAISDRSTVRYVDKTTEAGKTYMYKIVGINSFDIEGEESNTASVTVSEDKSVPVITKISADKSRLNKTAKITVSAEDNIDVESITIAYKTVFDDEYTVIDTVECESGTAVFNWDTTDLIDGSYSIKADAVDINGNISDETDTSEKKFTIDNTGISKIAFDQDNYTIASTYVSLRWHDVTESDFGYFSVEQKQPDGTFKEVGTSDNVTGLHVRDLSPDTEYTFRVVGYDDIGNRGIPSDELTVRTSSDKTNPVITAFYPESKAYNTSIDISVTATDNNSVGSVKLEYSYDSEEDKTWYPLTEITENTNNNFGYTFDISEMNEGTVYVKAVAVDVSGNESKPVISEFIVDRTAPTEISDLKVQTGEGNIHLAWTVTSDDSEKFLVYRSEGELNSYSLIAQCTTKDYYDTTAKLGVLYSYKVIAVDTAGNKSKYSNEAIAQITEDNTKPKLLGFNYKSGASLPANPKMSVVSWDNYALSSVTVEYKPKDGASGIWYEIGTFELSTNYEAADFTWDTDGLDDGKYEFRAYCEDLMGNISDTFTAEFTLDATAPDSPVLMLHQQDFRIELEWSEPKSEDADHYRIYRKDSKNADYSLLTKTTELEYTDYDVVPYKTYTYKIEAYDKTGNYSTSNELGGFAYDNDSIDPIIDVPDEMYGIAGEELVLDGSACTDNVKIKKYSWTVDNGETVFGKNTVYTFEESGNYTITLTVEDSSGNKAEKEIAVTIYEPSEYGYINVEVTDAQNNPLSYAYIYVYSGDSEGIHTMRTGYDGSLRLCAKIGDNKVAAYKDGYLPEEKNIAINSEGDNGTVKLTLQSGELVTGELEVHRMSLEEMAEAGIDFYNVSNYHYVRFTVKLTFAQEPIPTVYEYIYTGGGAGGSGSGESSDVTGHWIGGGTYGTSSGGKISFTPVVRAADDSIPDETQPILAYVYVNQGISFMKDMFSVNLGILNNAQKQFVIENSNATLGMPYGLSLVGSDMSLTRDMGSICGQEHKTASWAVRGDKKGEYDLTADFRGTLMPFEAPVYATFKTSTPFTVGAGDGIVIHVMPESCAYIGETYYVQLAVTNEGSDTFYNLTTDFGPYINPGQKEVITVTQPDGTVETIENNSACYEIQSADECEYLPVIVGGQEVRVKTFKPGDVIYGTYRQTFSAEGDPEKVYYKLIDSVVEQLTGDTNVKVVVEPIPSHISKHNVVQKIIDNSWADPVDMTTGAYTDQVTAMSVSGESLLNLNLNYNSLNVPENRERKENELFWYSQKGQLGYGWSHDFEAYLDVKDTVINVHWNPTSFSSFIDERCALRNVNGEIVDNRIVVHKPNDTGEKNYVCTSSGMSDYFMSRDENNIYTLEIPGGQQYVFDSEGRLIKIIQTNGKSTTLTHVGNTTTITEDNSGAKLVLNYNGDGLLTSISDGNGRITTLSYENDLLTSVTNPLGEKVVYTYDENDRLITAAIDGCDPYVTNTYDDDGRVIAQDDADPNTPLSYFSYSESENNEFIVDGTDRNGNTVKYVSDGIGHLLSVTDQNGNTVKYSYDLNGNLLDETTADGYRTVYTYDDDNNLIKVKDPSGNVTTMTYDDRGNILTVTSPTGDENVFTYNVKNLLLTQTEYTSAKKSFTYNQNGQILSEAIEGLGVRTYEYTDGRITAVNDYENNTSYNTYDEYGNLRSVTDREGHQTVYNYDLLNRLVSITNEDGTESYTYDTMGNKTSVTDSRGNTTTYVYNANNWLISSTNAKGTVSYSYDNEGRLVRQTNTDGTTVLNTYDAAGNVVSTTNENGEVTAYSYDAANRVVSKTLVDGDCKYTESYSYYPNGKTKKVTFADGTSESYTYDKQWRLIKTTDSSGNSVTCEYDANNNLLKTTDAEGNSTSYTYDKYGRMTSSTDANGNVTTYDEYDFNGLCTKKTLPNGQSIKIVYNKEGMVTQTTLLAGEDGGEDISVFYAYDAAGRVTEYTNEEGYTIYTEYDENGNIIKLKDAEGNIITNKYDEVNELVLTTNAIDVDTEYSYDSVGNLVKTIENLNTTREEQTANTFDNLGRISTSTDAENGTSSYTYDRLGNIVTVTDPNGGVNKYSYDIMGRITESENAIGSKKTYTYNDVGELASQKNARGQETTYEYYNNGWIKSFTDELGTVSYTYDGNGNVLTVTDENGTITREYDCMDHVTKYTDFRGNTIEYSYDQIGNLVAITYPGGRIVRYTYYKTGQLKSVTDWDGRITTYEYDGNGRLVKTTRPEGSVEERTYDAVGRLVTIVDKNGEEVINQTVYSYDESNNVTEVSMSDGTSIDGLTSAEMKYNAANQLIEYNGEAVEYDDDGNMTYGPLDGEMVSFVYDCRNRLVSAGGISYEYDAENNRISQTEDDVKTSYVVDSSSNALTRILTMTKGEDTTYFVYGAGLIAQENGGEYLTYHFNNIGNTQAITDETGEIVESYDYGPYGELLSGSECGIIFLYNGQLGVVTDNNGLYYMRARYYNPEIKRFINQDVLTGSITDSPSLNRYAYVNGNPISLNDPFGLSPMLNWLSGITGHDVLDVLGMIPGVGFVFDGINAAWYASEGDWFNAATSFVSMLPGLGDAVGVLAKGGKACKLVSAFHKAGAAGNLILGAYTLGNVAKKYISGDASFTWDEIKGDLFTVAMTGASMLGSAKDFGTSYCFVVGTLVTTADGFKPIEEIQVGDEVLSEDENTGEVSIKKVTQTYVNETDELVHIHVNGETISATPSHPFYVYKFGWTLAGSLRAGDVLVLSNGELVTVEWVQHELLESPIKVYNFEVEDFHTYFVGENSVLVHNGCGPDGEEVVGFREMMSSEDAERYDNYWKNVGAAKAEAARDAKLLEIDGMSNTKRNQFTTVVGAVDLETGAVAVGAKNTKIHGGQVINGKPICAEDLAVAALGGNKDTILMTAAIRPRTKEMVPVCLKCQGKYKRTQFVEGVLFE